VRRSSLPSSGARGFTDWIKAPVVAERDQALANLETCRGNAKVLEGSIAQQNRAIAAWEAEAARREEEGRKRGEEALKAAVARYNAAAAEQARKPLDPDLCVSARMRAQQYLERRRVP
jgi:peptidoglycan hydrolase CwlO-like protein